MISVTSSRPMRMNIRRLAAAGCRRLEDENIGARLEIWRKLVRMHENVRQQVSGEFAK